jgi:serine/threonine-protein kinase
MSIGPGSTVGPYQVVAPVGKGGMGEVFRARDPRLDRDVAIKVSTTEFSERFTREARSIAALNHSNICHLYDVGPNYLVLEYVEGDTLRGPMSFDDALPIIRQLIDGIEAAHEKNIIHRDLKTANIKLTPDGVVKILDFGLAKAGDSEARADLANSPTFTMDATQAGVILGTAAYMPPEQAKGRAADKRSDIWSFGVVVYELLTGRTPFEGETAVEILGAVLSKEPDWSRVPARAERLLRWCLEKDRKKRLAAIADARLLLEENTAAAQPAATETKSRSLLWPVVAATLLVAAGASAYGWWRATRPIERPLLRLSVDLGPDARIGQRLTAALSPDGTRIVFTGRPADGLSDRQQLFTRRLDQQNATPISGSVNVNAHFPFFSPDGQWIAFFAVGRVSKVGAQGGTAVAVGDIPGNAVGAAWGDDGNIIVGSLNGLLRLPSGGGTAQRLQEGSAPLQVFPDVLPGSKAVLFNTFTGGGETSTLGLDDLAISVMTLETGEVKSLVHGGYWPRYVKAGDDGYLIYVRQGTLFGVGFDADRLEIRGTPAPLLEDLAASSSPNTGGGQFAFSKTGTFVYLSGKGDSNDPYPISWLDDAGATMPIRQQAGAYFAPRLSPDGRRLAYADASQGAGNIFVLDLRTGTSTQVTFTNPGTREIAWSPDAAHLVYGDGSALWWIRADGSNQPHKLLESRENLRPMSFAPDGRLAYAESQGGLPNLLTVVLDLSDSDRPKAGTPEPFLTEPRLVEADAAFSPDGKFLAYASNESGSEEIFVQSFPPGGKWKISTGGGKFPAWSRTTRELFFLRTDGRIMVVSYTLSGDVFSPGQVRPWSPTPVRRTGTRQNFDVTSDGKRVVMFPTSGGPRGEGSLHLTFLFNFFDEIRRRIPAN